MKNLFNLDMGKGEADLFIPFVREYFKHTIEVVKIENNPLWIGEAGESIRIHLKAKKHLAHNPFIYYQLGYCWRMEYNRQLQQSLAI